MTTTTVTNGIDVDALVGTIDAIKSQPQLAEFTFKASTVWRDGTHATAHIGSFRHAGADDESRAAGFLLHGDEPGVLLGKDQGPNAVELLLAALGLCYSVGYVANAAARGIEIEEMSYEVEGDLDVHAFLGLSDEVRPGFSEIRATAYVKAPRATQEELTELCRYVQATSPVRDALANAVPVRTTIEAID
jgi:uncharacterized OsmC-like protein